MARLITDSEAGLYLPTEATELVAMLARQTLQLHAPLRKLDRRLAVLQLQR